MPCDGVISNNVMDYNSNQHSYSPCQIAKTERTLSKLKGNRRALVKKTWCTHNPKNDLVIQDTTHWNRVVDFDGNIIIADGGMLILSCHLNMAEKSAITVQAGGELILHKATLYNDCGYDWNGIKLEGTKKIMGKLSYIDTFYIENVPSINL